MDEPDDLDLLASCTLVARRILVKNGAASNDVVDTLARKFLEIAEEYRDYVRQNRETDDVMTHAVAYIADVHAVPPCGTDAEWFDHTLRAIMELAVPSTDLTESALRVLPHIQRGIQQSLSDVRVTRDSMRITDEDAEAVQWMVEAGIEHGVTSDLLDLLDRIYHGDPMHEDDQRLLRLAAVAAPLTRRAREKARLR